MSHKIVNLNDEKIKACFQFMHGGHTVSCSSIFNKNTVEVAYWFNDLGDVHTVNCVQSAIYAIDEINKNDK
jgi:hypothetical protein